MKLILLKQLLEQLGGRDSVFKSYTPNSTPESSAKITAKKIYDSKGVVWDDEKGAIRTIRRNIKNIQQYKDVTKELQKLTNGRGIGQYLRSFTSNSDRLKIIEYLSEILPENQWHWTILKIMPYSDFKVLMKQDPSLYDKWSGNVTSNPVSKMELRLMNLYKPEIDRSELYTSKWNSDLTDLNDVQKFFGGSQLRELIKTAPLHVRCFYDFIVGRTKPLTENDLNDAEKQFLIKVSRTYGIKHGFNYPYWKGIGSTGTTSMKGNTGTLTFRGNLATQFQYTIGEVAPANVVDRGNRTIQIKDHYDFNSKEYKMTKEQIINDFIKSAKNVKKDGKGLYQALRRAANLRELTGYYGYDVNIILKY